MDAKERNDLFEKVQRKRFCSELYVFDGKAQRKDLYRKMDNDKVYDKFATMLTDNSTIYDAMFLAGSFYTFLQEKTCPKNPALSMHLFPTKE